MPEKELSFCELTHIALRGASVAIVFQAIRASREHIHEPFDWRHLTSGLVSAGGVGALAAWVLDEFSVDTQVRAVVIAMCGYVGGPLLDILYAEVPELIKAGFDGAQEWLRKGRWDRSAGRD